MTMATNIIVAAIDFGTTYSGWAFSFTHEYKRDPTQVSAKNWSGGKLLSQKSPTTVLIRPDGKTFEAFGYEAEDKYAELAADGEHEQWYFFRRFKMLLMDRIDLNRDIGIEDETGKELSAKLIFSMAIKYLKDDLLKECASRIAGIVRPEEIMWVLTVPAIWNDSAKQFMREASVEAGIKNEKLRIALEPETASLFCRLLPVEKMEGEVGISAMKEGSKYMVLDAGGGTVDITVHQIIKGGKLKEVHKASGGAWGGTKVDEAYKQFLISIVGKPVFDKFIKNHIEDYLDLIREFEIKKREVDPQKNSKVTIRFPTDLKELFKEETGEELKEAIQQTKYAGNITHQSDKIRVDAEVFQSFFEGAMQSIVDHVSMLLQKPDVRNIDQILMVGGFSESKMLQDAIKRNFYNKTIVVPRDAGTVVLKGAVVFGHNPGVITERIARYTYGVQISCIFKTGEHDESTKTIDGDGTERCSSIFRKHKEMGQPISWEGDTNRIELFSPDSKATSFPLRIYASTDMNPKYVTDEGCFKLGEMTVSVDTSVPFEQRKFLLTISYGGTEITVKANEIRTGRETTCIVNFLG